MQKERRKNDWKGESSSRTAALDVIIPFNGCWLQLGCKRNHLLLELFLPGERRRGILLSASDDFNTHTKPLEEGGVSGLLVG